MPRRRSSIPGPMLKSMPRLTSGLFLALALLLAMGRAAPARADALIDNVNGVTLDGEGRQVRFTGVLVTADGRVARLLGQGDKRPDTLDWRTDMGGRTLLPGFVDAHGHVMELGWRALRLDLSATNSLDEALARIAAYAAANPDRKWITGGGWNQERWRLGRFPTAADLDKVVRDRPVWLERADGHAAWGNSLAMRLAGVTAKSVAPAGGRIERIGGVPSGVFVDQARALVDKVVPEPNQRDRNAAFLTAQRLLLANGVTAAADMGSTVDDWLTYRRMGDIGQLRVRIIAYGAGVDAAVRIGGTGPSPWLYADRLRLAGVKLYADGALGSRGAWLKRPYQDRPGESGAGFLTDDQLRNLMSRAALDHFQVAVHAIGDRANAQVLDAIDALADTYSGDRRWRIEHAQIVDPADLPRFGTHGIVASMQPVHQTSDRTMAEARLGPDRLTGAYAWASMLKNGARLAFGTDFPVESPDPFAGWAAAITRTDAEGQPQGGWQAQEAIGFYPVWYAYTQGAAYAGFAEDKFGRLAVGQRADFIIVDRDPTTATPSELRGIKVLETWVGGEQVWTRG